MLREEHRQNRNVALGVRIKKLAYGLVQPALAKIKCSYSPSVLKQGTFLRQLSN